MQLSFGGPTSAWLQSMVVSGREDWSFDLSSQFQSNVSDYGVIVPFDFDNATLCTVAFRGKLSTAYIPLALPALAVQPKLVRGQKI